jgi:hypothetical protein
MKLYRTTLILLALTANWSLAEDVQFAIGSIIKQFELPQRDQDGNLQSTIYGREATVMSQNRIRVRGLNIDIFSGDRIGTRLSSPESDFWSEEGRLTTSNGVTVVQPEFTLTSVNMDWDLKHSKGVFSQRVRVVIPQQGSLLDNKPPPGGEKAKQ